MNTLSTTFHEDTEHRRVLSMSGMSVLLFYVLFGAASITAAVSAWGILYSFLTLPFFAGSLPVTYWSIALSSKTRV